MSEQGSRKARDALKQGARMAFRVLMLPVVAAFHLLAVLANEDAAFKAFSETLALIPGKVGVYMRAAFYSMVCPETATDVSIGFMTLLSHRDTTIGAGTYIGPQCNIGKARIGDECLLGSGVHVLSGRHQHSFSDPTKPIKHQGGAFTKISIGSDCWIGNNAVIMADLGDRCVVAAGAVVTRAFDAGSVVGGNPAKQLSLRESADSVEQTNELG